MRVVATAAGSRPFAGAQADLTTAMAAIAQHDHNAPTAPVVADLLADAEPWPSAAESLSEITRLLTTEADRREAAHAAFLVALMPEEADAEGLHTARWLARSLHADDAFAADLEATVTQHAAAAEADLFRRFLSWKTGVDLSTIQERMARQLPVVDTPPEEVEELRRRFAAAKEGTVGYELSNFYRDTGFDIPGTPGTLPLAVLGSHDVHHVLTGYDASPEDEVYLAAFTAANARNGGAEYLAVITLQWHQGIRLGVFDPARATLDPTKMVLAAERGARTPVDVCTTDWNWEALIETPLELARELLGIPPGGSVGPSGLWDAGHHQNHR